MAQLIRSVSARVDPSFAMSQRYRSIQSLTRLLAQALPRELALRPQLPLTLEDDSEPEPDLAVVRLEDARSREHHPRTALLVVEVAGDSQRLENPKVEP